MQVQFSLIRFIVALAFTALVASVGVTVGENGVEIDSSLLLFVIGVIVLLTFGILGVRYILSVRSTQKHRKWGLALTLACTVLVTLAFAVVIQNIDTSKGLVFAGLFVGWLFIAAAIASTIHLSRNRNRDPEMA